MQAPACQGPDPRPKRPRDATPRGACDAHAHLFGPFARFPLATERSYTPPEAPLERYLDVLDTLGLDRGVIVQGSAHGTDNAVLLDALVRAPERLRGIAVVAARARHAELRRMADAGVRGLRFNHLLREGRPVFAGGAGIDAFSALERTMAELDWHLQLWIHCRDLPALWPSLATAAVPIVVDHMGRIDARLGPAQPGFEFMRQRLAEGRIWVKLSGAYRASAEGPGYAEVRAFHRALFAANAEQCLWGLDWPHAALEAPMPNDGTLLDLFNDWTDDRTVRHRILVDNPARLFGFAAHTHGAPS